MEGLQPSSSGCACPICGSACGRTVRAARFRCNVRVWSVWVLGWATILFLAAHVLVGAWVILQTEPNAASVLKSALLLILWMVIGSKMLAGAKEARQQQVQHVVVERRIPL